MAVAVLESSKTAQNRMVRIAHLLGRPRQQTRWEQRRLLRRSERMARMPGKFVGTNLRRNICPGIDKVPGQRFQSACSAASVTAQNAANVIPAFAAWEYSHCRRSISQSATCSLQSEVMLFTGWVQI